MGQVVGILSEGVLAGIEGSSWNWIELRISRLMWKEIYFPAFLAK
jgi:hypothetical protein